MTQKCSNYQGWPKEYWENVQRLRPCESSVQPEETAQAVSTRVCQRAGMVEVHKLLHDEYKVDIKVVFQYIGTRGLALTVMAAWPQDTQRYVRPLEEMLKG